MQTSHSIHPAAALAWTTQGERHDIRTVFADAVPQITQIRFTAGDETDDTVWTVTDDETGQVYGPIEGTGSATEATMLDNAVAALEVSEIGRKLFTFTEDGVDDVVATARHVGRSYTFAVTGGTSVTAPAVSELQAAAGPPSLTFGFLAKGSAARSVQAIGATTALADLAGVLWRNEARALRQLPDVDPDVVQVPNLSIARDLVVWIPFESGAEPEPGGDVFLRRATTSGAGSVGSLRDAPAGSAQVSTYTPVADMLAYGFEYGYNGQHYVVHYVPTDGTTAVADACDGLVAQANIDIPDGVAITDSATAVTITTDAGTQLDYLRATVSTLDADTAAGVAALGAADIDTIDVSSVVEVIETLPGLGLALCHVDL